MNRLQAHLNVLFRLQGQPDREIEFVVDTGFEGALTLPPATVAALGLPFFQEMDASLADDQSVKTDVHVARIVLDGREAEVVVLAMGSRPLLGTALLEGRELRAQFVENGSVTVETL